MQPPQVDLLYYMPVVEGAVTLSFTEYMQMPLREMVAFQEVLAWNRERSTGKKESEYGEQDYSSPQMVDGLEVHQFDASKATWAWYEIGGKYREKMEERGNIKTVSERERIEHDERISKLRNREWEFISKLDDPKLRQCAYEHGITNSASKSRDALLSEIYGVLGLGRLTS